jgi:hypothetical protein
VHGDEEHRRTDRSPGCTCTPYPYGDGPEVDCPVHGDPERHPCGLCGLVPRDGEQHRALFAVGQTGEDAEEVCIGPDRRQLDYAPLPGTEPAPVLVPDPWASPGPVPPPPF